MKLWEQLASLTLISLIPTAAYAQIIPDSTVGTQVTPNVNINGILSDVINGGAIKGSNLFHSFSEFNIDSGRGAYFSNPNEITNIFTRVTGTNPSNINGILGVLGNANLFFMNPNGIIFGTAGKLDLQGSFIGTTASNINFADGTQFSTSNPTSILTVSVPVGLGFGNNPGTIRVEGTGHTITNFFIGNTSDSGLRVQPGKTLALVGGDIIIASGGITAPQGQVELGGVSNGLVSLNPTTSGWTLGYAGVQDFRDVRLSERALLDASGNGSGSIQVQGKQVSITDGSVMTIMNRGSQPGGVLRINAAESVEVNGFPTDPTSTSVLLNGTFGGANGGEIAIATKHLYVRDGGAIISVTAGNAPSGNITVNAEESLELTGFNPIGNSSSSITTQTGGSGAAGNITLSTKRLAVSSGGLLVSATAGIGNGGNLTLNATDSIEVTGFRPGLFVPSTINSSSYNAGNAGNLTINTSKLIVRSGGRIDTSNFASGNAGKLTIDATKSVEVNGTLPGSGKPSQINSSANIFDLASRQSLGLPPFPSGASGDVTINTDFLTVTDGGLINVSNEGVGNAGTATVNATKVLLDNFGGITAATLEGSGGEIFVRSRSLLLRHNSAITATAGGRGNGGNINLDVDALAQLENSNITANAVQGKGGNININTQGIFRSTDSNITASSQLGINGIVNITTPDIKQDNSLQEQPSNFINAQQIVANSCLASRNTQNGKFVITGNGGVPETPDSTDIPYEVTQVQPILISKKISTQHSENIHAWKLGDAITEAKQLRLTPDGRMVLSTTINNREFTNIKTLTCQ